MSSTILDFFHVDSGGGGNGRIYGVKFDGTNSVGTRLLAAKNLNFSPSNTTTAGVDDFITIENSPFHIRECITDYSELTNKQRILAYEGDSNWNQLVEAKIGNRMIEFPKFWYKRPSKWEWYVSSEPFSGALPSPMHYRNGVMHDYVYVAKYMANSEYKSQSGQNILSHTPLSTFRTEYRKQGLYVWDYALHCSINMLLFIKYGNMNVQKFLGQGISMTTSHRVNTGLADNILGKDGYSGNTIAEDSSVLCMGIENYYGNLWHSVDGVFKNGSRLYINTDIESITSNPSSSSHNGYTVCPTSFFSPSTSGNYWITDIAYDSQFPWMMFPTNGTWVANQNTLVEPEGLMIGDTYSSDDSSSDFHITLGGRYTNGYTCGLLGIGANMGMDFYSNEDDVISFCSFFLSEDVTVPNSPKIYGVKFDGTNSTGTRLENSEGLRFTPSNTTTAGIDDFMADQNSPFAIRECISDYNSSTGKQEVIAYEGDSNWNTLVANKTGNRMIEFPKFYYKRPSKWEFYVSSDEKPGFLPSPMHYRNGKMHDYVYAAKYSSNSSFKSQPNETILVNSSWTNSGGYNIEYFRNNFRSQGMYVWDYALVCSINMLLIVKYKSFDIQSIIGSGISNAQTFETGGSLPILGKDGYVSSNKDDIGDIICLGIENYYGDCWKFVDGCFRIGSTFYVNTDIENITSNSSSGYSSYSGHVTNSTQLGWIGDISYNTEVPWLMYPTSGYFSNVDTNQHPGIFIPDAVYTNNVSGEQGCLFGGGYGYKYGNGPFFFTTNMYRTGSASNFSANSFFLSDSYT